MDMYLHEKTPVQIILKLTGNSCNLNCSYCYERVRPYHSKNYMDISVVEKIITLFDSNRNISIQLHGGEPLLYGIDKTRDILKIINSSKKNIKINIQTNGVLLNHDWMNLLCYEYPKTELGISLDGDYLANSYRINQLGENQTANIENALRLCSQYKKDIGLISVVNKRMIGREKEILEYFKKFLCIKAINFMPCYDFKIINTKDEQFSGSVTIKEYHDFIKKIFLIWKNNISKYPIIIDPIFSIICTILNKKVSLCHYSKFKCANIFTVYPDGTIGSCDEINLKYGNFGNVFSINSLNDLIKKQKENSFFHHILEINQKCRACNNLKYCNEGCISSRMNFEHCGLQDEYCDYSCDLINFVSNNI